MNPALLSKPEETKAKAAPAKAKKTAKAKRKVWSGVRKRHAVSHLQLTLPGIGGSAL
jgi:hypothetical protein